MTQDQQIASDPAASAWVSASAGTGKTKVLTDRVLRLLLAGAAPQRILCITYTRAASAEMEARIGAELARWVTLPDEALTETLDDLTGRKPATKTLTRARRLFACVQDAPERVRIKTIHGFCQSVLARFPLEADVPPQFEAADEIAARELLAEARAQLFRKAASPGADALAEAVAEFAGTIAEMSFHKLIEEIIRQRRRFSAASLEPGRIYQALGLDAARDEVALAQKHLQYTDAEVQALRQACEVLAQSAKPTDHATSDALRLWLAERADAQRYSEAYITGKGTPRKTFFTKDCAKLWPPLAEVLAAEQKRMLAWDEEARSQQVARLSSHVATLAASMLDLYEDLKRRRGCLDYDDLILRTLRLLQNPGVAPWVLFKLDGGIDHLLIDEAQDTTPEQWHIARALAEEFFAGDGARNAGRTVFVVGDEKQSIYSFQGANPHEFDEMQRRLAQLAAGAEKPFRRVRLDLSFRSTVPVLSAVDSIFAQAPARDGIIFGESDIRHEASRVNAEGRVELWPLVEAPQQEEVPGWSVPEGYSGQKRPELLCAAEVAGTIEQWLLGQRILAPKGRPVEPGDIMVLVQRRGLFVDTLLRELKRRGIPVAGADRLPLAEHIAVMDCMALARFLLLPRDDLSLAEVLRSPFIGLSEEELFALAHSRGQQTLWQRLEQSPAHAGARQFLADLLGKTDYLPPYELFAHVLEASGGRRKLAERLGDEITDPLNEFLALALEYGKTYPPSLQGFLHWLETGEIEIKRDMEKGRNEVRILTVHGAKGLQAPIVFLPDTVRMPPPEGGIFWTHGAHPVPLWSQARDFDDRHYRALREARRVEMEREYRRLFYVALTRAEDELYICGWKGKREISSGCWYDLARAAAQGWGAEGDKRVLKSQQAEQVEAKPAVPVLPGNPPAWVYLPAKDEPVPPRPLAPSRLGPVEGELSPFAGAAYDRGLLVHRLLQYLPEVAAGERVGVMRRFFERYGGALPQEEKEILGAEVLAVLANPEFAPVFAPGSLAEASIAGVAGEGGVTIAGRIDRLAVLEHDVYIIDYKTGRRVPADASSTPVAYLRQMEAYRQLVREIYRDKTVHCALLWTAGPKLIPLPEALLQSLAA